MPGEHVPGEHVTDLNGCARCHGDGHEGLVFKPLEHAVEDADGEYTHWAPCPTNGEPILMRFQDKDSPVVTLYVPVDRDMLERLYDGVDVSHVRAVKNDDGTHQFVFTAAEQLLAHPTHAHCVPRRDYDALMNQMASLQAKADASN